LLTDPKREKCKGKKDVGEKVGWGELNNKA